MPHEGFIWFRTERDIEIRGWCPAGKSYLMGTRCLFGHPSSDGVTIKIPYGVDVLLHRTASHIIFFYWAG